MCLAQDQFLNDVIIDFYLKYLVLNMSKEQQEKVHVFSTFFYKRLTTKPLKASRYNNCLNTIIFWTFIFVFLETENSNAIKSRLFVNFLNVNRVTAKQYQCCQLYN